MEEHAPRIHAGPAITKHNCLSYEVIFILSGIIVMSYHHGRSTLVHHIKDMNFFDRPSVLGL